MNPAELGSPWTSALSSFATFAVGALVPLVPWFITTGLSAVVGSLALAGGAAVAIAKTLFLQMLLPIVVGMLAVQFLPNLAKKISAVGRHTGQHHLVRPRCRDTNRLLP